MDMHNRIKSYLINMHHPGAVNIVLYDSRDTIVGQYIFSSEIVEPVCERQSGGGSPSVKAPLSDLPLVLDLLRNEKPLFFGAHLHLQPPWAYLSTSQEPVGEGEKD